MAHSMLFAPTQPSGARSQLLVAAGVVDRLHGCRGDPHEGDRLAADFGFDVVADFMAVGGRSRLVPRHRGTVGAMEPPHALDRINELLDSADAETANTSMRIPIALRQAATLAVEELGAAPSTTALTTAALRATLEALVMQAALDHHYEQHPQARPSLADLAIAAARLDTHPLAVEPERIRRAAIEIVAFHPDADPDDVLLWAEAQAFVSA